MTALVMGKHAASEVRKFSVAFAILSIIPAVLVLFFVLAAAVKLGWVELNRALLVLLLGMIVVYFIVPRMSARLEATAKQVKKK